METIFPQESKKLVGLKFCEYKPFHNPRHGVVDSLRPSTSWDQTNASSISTFTSFEVAKEESMLTYGLNFTEGL